MTATEPGSHSTRTPRAQPAGRTPARTPDQRALRTRRVSRNAAMVGEFLTAPRGGVKFATSPDRPDARRPLRQRPVSIAGKPHSIGQHFAVDGSPCACTRTSPTSCSTVSWPAPSRSLWAPNAPTSRALGLPVPLRCPTSIPPGCSASCPAPGGTQIIGQRSKSGYVTPARSSPSKSTTPPRLGYRTAR
jgi:hypothetical protein